MVAAISSSKQIAAGFVSTFSLSRPTGFFSLHSLSSLFSSSSSSSCRRQQYFSTSASTFLCARAPARVFRDVSSFSRKFSPFAFSALLSWNRTASVSFFSTCDAAACGTADMQLLPFGSASLYQKHPPVDVKDIKTPAFYNRLMALRECMTKSDGMGLAGPQVGWNSRVFVMGMSEQECDEAEDGDGMSESELAEIVIVGGPEDASTTSSNSSNSCNNSSSSSSSGSSSRRRPSQVSVRTQTIPAPVGYMYWINPVITFRSVETNYFWEGCCSVPGVLGWVQRPAKIQVSGFDENGRYLENCLLTGGAARIFQHEFDHLEGVLFPTLVKDASFMVPMNGLREGQCGWADHWPSDGARRTPAGVLSTVS